MTKGSRTNTENSNWGKVGCEKLETQARNSEASLTTEYKRWKTDLRHWRQDRIIEYFSRKES